MHKAYEKIANKQDYEIQANEDSRNIFQQYLR